jgi:putative oxidoreductase
MDRSAREAWGLAILRLAVGLIFFVHGWMNVLGGREAFLRLMFEMAGWSPPDLLIWLLTALEFLGGLALLVGIFTRPVAFLLAAEMVGAMAMFYIREGLVIVAVPNVPLAYASEYPLALVGALVCLALAGPGYFALENRLAARGSSGSTDALDPAG